MILRDHLAYDWTKFALLRTFLVDPWFEGAEKGVLARSPWPERNVASPLVELPCLVEEVLISVDGETLTY